jgi:hypothetical protein
LKRLNFGLIPLLLLLLAACSNEVPAMIKVDLAPIPYSLEVPAEIANRLSVENVMASTPNQFANQAREAGAIAQVNIKYQAADGTMHGFAGVYYFKKTDFDKAQNPNEPPLYGSKVLEEESMVLSIAGPQGYIFEPNSQDDKNSTTLYKLIYEPKSFRSSGEE